MPSARRCKALVRELRGGSGKRLVLMVDDAKLAPQCCDWQLKQSLPPLVQPSFTTQLPSLPGENSQLSPNLLQGGSALPARSRFWGQPAANRRKVQQSKRRMARASLSPPERERGHSVTSSPGPLKCLTLAQSTRGPQLNSSDTERPS